MYSLLTARVKIINEITQRCLWEKKSLRDDQNQNNKIVIFK